MTTASFRYADPATMNAAGSPLKPWSKVDTDASSYGRTERRRSVTDIRTATLASQFGVDAVGFSFLQDVPANEQLFIDDVAIRTGYYHEVEQLLREHMPRLCGERVARIAIFDHTVRRHNPQSPRQPVQQVHVDQTPGAAAQRVRKNVATEAEAEALMRKRYQIINVWRPIGHAASDFPLALVDWRTTDPTDAVAVDLLYPTWQADTGGEVLPVAERAQSTEGYAIRGKYTNRDGRTTPANLLAGETYSIIPNDKHKFYYVKDMTPDEVLLIKCFDSCSEAMVGGRSTVAAWTPHTAFFDPATPADAMGRQSIEVRCLVFYE